MDITELDRESAELVPDRQALGSWNFGYGGSHTSINLNLLNNVLNHDNILNITSILGGSGL